MALGRGGEGDWGPCYLKKGEKIWGGYTNTPRKKTIFEVSRGGGNRNQRGAVGLG